MGLEWAESGRTPTTTQDHSEQIDFEKTVPIAPTDAPRSVGGSKIGLATCVYTLVGLAPEVSA
jgi:hypothetical protein